MVKQEQFKPGSAVAERDSIPDRLTVLKVLQDTQCIVTGIAIYWCAAKLKAKSDTELPNESRIALPYKCGIF
jgi:hypothetical protein